MSAKIRVAVIGVGYLGRFHALIYSRMSDVELVGVVDTNTENGRKVAEEAGCEFFTDPAELLGRIDAVSVVVPTTAHLDVARPFLEQGVHMLMEKPIATTVEQGRQIVDLARASGVVLQIGHLERFNAGIMALASRINNPRFIEAHRMGEFVARATDVDVVSDLMIHDIDIILSLVGSEIVNIQAVGTQVLTDHIDIANARLEFANGTVANVIASRVSRERSRRIRVFGRNRYQSLDFISQRLETAYAEHAPGEEWPEVKVEAMDIEPVKPLDKELEAFINSVRTGEAPLVDGETGLKALDVAIQVKEKILAGVGSA